MSCCSKNVGRAQRGTDRRRQLSHPSAELIYKDWRAPVKSRAALLYRIARNRLAGFDPAKTCVDQIDFGLQVLVDA